jgi:hypothetical protein
MSKNTISIKHNMDKKITDIISRHIGGTYEAKQKCAEEILCLFGKSDIILIQQWEEDPNDKTGWSTWGWEYENGNLFDEVGYELKEVLEEDKYGHITKACFKYVG